MQLLIQAQDIATLCLGLIKPSSLPVFETREAQPKHYLAMLDEFLRAHDVRSHQITRVLVVTGPGSFTSTRIATILANTFHYANSCELRVMQNSTHRSLHELVEYLNESVVLNEQTFASPVYDRPSVG